MFPKEGLQFLRALKKNNNRDWFQARKHIYDEHVKAPMFALIDEINKALVKLEPGFITDPKKAMFRIYRDTRFSHDKTPYKTVASALFSRKQLDKLGGGVLYVAVSPAEVVVASGSYMPGPPELLAIRQHLAEHHKEFRKILKGRELGGEELQRPPKGFGADHPAIDLIRKKQWLLRDSLPGASALEPDFSKEVIRRLRLMIPFVGFLNAPMLARAGKVRDPLIDAPGRDW